MNKKKHLSTLPKTWIFDLDGTLITHNGFKQEKEEILCGVKEFFKENVKEEDYVIITTGRPTEHAEAAIKLLAENGIKVNNVISNLPLGERLLFNDIKPNTGLKTAFSFNLERNGGLKDIKFIYDK